MSSKYAFDIEYTTDSLFFFAYKISTQFRNANNNENEKRMTKQLSALNIHFPEPLS